MTTKKECNCAVNIAGIMKDASILRARSETLNRLIERYGLSHDAKESSMMEIRDNARYLSIGIKSFEYACDISKLGHRLDQYKLGKQKLEQFSKEPENLNLTIDAGRKILGSVISNIDKGLIGECK